jgi:hypothetical protein
MNPGDGDDNYFSMGMRIVIILHVVTPPFQSTGLVQLMTLPVAVCGDIRQNAYII